MPATNTRALHHYHIRKRIYKKYETFPSKKKLKRVFDRFMYVVVVLGLLINLPQLFKIWMYKEASGVSVISWFGFSVLSVIWVVYGVLHKEKPIIFMSSGLVIIQALVAIGALIYG